MPTRLTCALPIAPLLAVLVSLTASCTRPPEPMVGEPESPVPVGARPDPDVLCAPTGGVPQPDGAFVFGLTESVNGDHAPVPHNLSETVVFRNLYETLVVAGCTGELRPGLAEAWTSDADHRVWTFRMRAEACFWNGAPVTAQAVLAAWERNRTLPRPADRHSPWVWLDAAIETALASSDDELVVTLHAAQPHLPYLLAHPACGVATLAVGWRWPVGSGPGRLQATSIEPAPDLICQPNLHHPEQPAWRSLTFRVLPAADPRDLFALGADLLLARHQLDVDYYADVSTASLTPLPWDRVYLLLLSAPDPPVDPQAAAQRYGSVVAAVAGNRDDLVTAVAAASAFAADHPGFTTFRGPSCPVLSADAFVGASSPLTSDPSASGLGPESLLYPAGDIDAQRLAERVAFFPPGFRSTVAVPPRQFARQLQAGAAGGYVLALPREYATSCLTLADVVARASWLATELGDPALSSADDDQLGALYRQFGARLIPLVYTRPHLVARGRLAGVALTYEGVPLLGRAGWVAASPEVRP